MPFERADALAELGRLTFVQAYDDEGDPEGFGAYVEEAFSVEAIARSMREAGTRFRWLLDRDTPVAYLKVLDRAIPPGNDPGTDDAPVLHLQRLYVRATHQGNGLGALLLRDAAACALGAGAEFLWLTVWDENTDAIAFYAHLGLRTFGEHPFQLGNRRHRDLLMGIRIRALYTSSITPLG